MMYGLMQRSNLTAVGPSSWQGNDEVYRNMFQRFYNRMTAPGRSAQPAASGGADVRPDFN